MTNQAKSRFLTRLRRRLQNQVNWWLVHNSRFSHARSDSGHFSFYLLIIQDKREITYAAHIFLVHFFSFIQIKNRNSTVFCAYLSLTGLSALIFGCCCSWLVQWSSQFSEIGKGSEVVRRGSTLLAAMVPFKWAAILSGSTVPEPGRESGCEP